MQNNTNNDRNERPLKRSVSLDPRMTSTTNPTNEASIHVNPLFDGTPEDTADSRNASIRRQVSEPARNRHKIVSNIISRTESIKSIVMKGTQQFFGITSDNDSEAEVWRQRRRRLIRTYGKLKESEQTVVPLQTRQSSEATENERQFAPDLTPEESSRSPALRITFKAIALASNTLKKKIAKRSDHQIRSDSQTEGTVDRRQSYVIADSVLYPSGDLSDEDNEDFFTKPLEEIPEEEVDGRHAMSGRPQTENKWSIQRQVSVKAKSIPEQIIQTLLKTDNSNRREFGMGWIDRILDRRLRKDLTKEERKAFDHIDDYRPFFTYWITTVQTLILIISLSVYGFGYSGFGGFEHITGLVYVKSLSLQQIDYFEPQNFWIGPRPADLIHLGAKYTPCMRRDERIYDIIDDERNLEKNTGCCVRNDGSGCVQTSQDKCSPLLSTWYKWPNRGSNSEGRISGPVCGQDPKSCQQPASIEPYKWADDITKWPMCLKKGKENKLKDPHMSCELIGRPCCLGVYGQCHITTREHCDFMKGVFHESANLCSQVSCMEDVCGMIPFYSKDTPDQKIRLLTPIFLHAGLVHLLITGLFQFVIMKDLEKVTGSTRMAIIYLGSGFSGYLASAVFLPFRPEVGPAGSLYGVLACLIVQVINEWQYLQTPILVVLKLGASAGLLFLLGLLPWIDNYAHVFGFVIGFLLSLALLPEVTPTGRPYDKRKRIILIISCLSAVLLIIIVLFVLLQNYPIYDIKFFKYINCVPLTPDWCANQDIQINRVDIL